MRIPIRKQPESRRETRVVAVARDVIGQVRTGMFLPTQKEYLGTKTIGAIKDKYGVKFKGLNLQEPFCKLDKPCHVCGIGSMFVSHVRLFDGVKVEGDDMLYYNSVSREVIVATLRKHVGVRLLNRIETAFMKLTGYFDLRGDECYPDELDKAHHLYPEAMQHVRFGRLFKKDKIRLTAIMVNLIRNGGNFDPEDHSAKIYTQLEELITIKPKH
jgi:hypothetical protein